MATKVISGGRVTIPQCAQDYEPGSEAIFRWYAADETTVIEEIDGMREPKHVDGLC